MTDERKPMPARSGTLDAIDAVRGHIDQLKDHLEGEVGYYYREAERLRARVTGLEARLAVADALILAVAHWGFNEGAADSTDRIAKDVIAYVDNMRRK